MTNALLAYLDTENVPTGALALHTATLAHHAWEGDRIVSGSSGCIHCGKSTADPSHWCAFDNCRPLRIKQKRFASKQCSDAYYHRFTPPKESKAGSIQARILEYLGDGLQRTTLEIAVKLNVGEATLSREMRKLRAKSGARVHKSLLPPRPGSAAKRAVYWLPKK